MPKTAIDPTVGRVPSRGVRSPGFSLPPAQPNEQDDWINLKETAALLHCSITTAWELCTRIDPLTGRPYLLSRRPTRFLYISRASVEAHLAATQTDPHFWTKRRK
jgi:hypothetical protein